MRTLLKYADSSFKPVFCVLSQRFLNQRLPTMSGPVTALMWLSSYKTIYSIDGWVHSQGCTSVKAAEQKSVIKPRVLYRPIPN